MAIKYTKLFRQECEGKLGITRLIVRDAVEKPDKQQSLSAQGLNIVMFSKKTRKGDHLIVNAHVDADNLIVDLVFRVKDTIVKQTKTNLPFPLMRALAHKFGLPIRIGEHLSKFIYNELIPVSNSDIRKVVRIPNPGNRPLISIIWIRMIQNNMGPMAQCALVICIDARKYRAWLKG